MNDITRHEILAEAVRKADANPVPYVAPARTVADGWARTAPGSVALGREHGRADRAKCETADDVAHYVAVAVGNLDAGPYRAGYLDGITGTV